MSTSDKDSTPPLNAEEAQRRLEDDPGFLTRQLTKAVDRAVRIQDSTVDNAVARIRRKHPDATPQEVIDRLTTIFRTAATASGGAVGATAAVPGIGTIMALGATTAEGFVFLDAAALYAMSIAKVHGLTLEDEDHRRTVVLAVILGSASHGVLEDVLGDTFATTAAGGMFSRLSPPSLRSLNARLGKKLAKKTGRRMAMLMLGRLAPLGIGAAIGAWGNRRLAAEVIDRTQEVFGAAPTTWPKSAPSQNKAVTAPSNTDSTEFSNTTNSGTNSATDTAKDIDEVVQQVRRDVEGGTS